MPSVAHGGQGDPAATTISPAPPAAVATAGGVATTPAGTAPAGTTPAGAAA
jgi:hypothetical protein